MFDASDGSYGYWRLHAELLRGGERVGLELVRTLMREVGLVAYQPRAWRTTTVRGQQATAAAHVVGRDFSCQAPGCKLVGDITYIRTWASWLYLATVIDCRGTTSRVGLGTTSRVGLGRVIMSWVHLRRRG